MDHRFIHWLGHASFRLEDTDQSIYIDPWKLPRSSPPADLILITHPHYDHLSLPDINRIFAPATLVVATPDASKQLSMEFLRALPGRSLEAGPWHIETVAAYNATSSYHPKANGWVGYVIRLKDGTTVYHSGDTDLTPELEQVKADVALLACGGTYTMDGKAAGKAANSIGPKFVIPMHWGDIVGAPGDAAQLRSTFTGQTVILEPER